MKFLISVFLVLSLYGKVIDKIEIIVNDIPITSYDISKTQKKLNVDKNRAVSYLIDQSVLKSAIKKRGIFVDEFDIDNMMKNLAQKNGMSLFNFKNYLLQKGELEELKSQIKKKLEMDKLFQSLNIRVEKEEVKKYYNSHKDEFKIAQKIEVTQYSASNKDDLIASMNNPMLQNNNVELKDMSLDISKTNPRLMLFLSKQKEGSFTPIVKMENKLVSFYIIKKDNYTTIPFDKVAGEIYQKLMMKRQQIAIKDFISKLKAKANIEILTK